MQQPVMTLNDGRRMPQMGLGIWQIPAGETALAVGHALRAGYRLIDGAARYGNEAGLGQAVRDSGLPREEIFVTSKLWNDQRGRDAARRGFDVTMERLGLDYLNLYLIHWPVPAQDLYVETWKALIELRDEGRVKSIGVANFHEPHLIRLIDETGVTPVLNQIELHPGFTQARMRAVHERLGIVTQSWAPLGRGADFTAGAVAEIAARLGVEPAQVIIAWHLAHGLSVIPKSLNPERQKQNLAALELRLSDADIAAIDALDRGIRTGPDPEEFSG
ncbi:aldo/keto reductase [Paracoccus methylarcula]|uniref:Oxidoreductase n=1 Tax=Paracoccus methylarcula TaxID=72022 RepID=A0A422QYW1_9RHOB|nr:aldo/keto reductase [Paracoccus methylarcula]RNF35165.1 oxidoreductase [Paracoccus methylarcula]